MKVLLLTFAVLCTIALSVVEGQRSWPGIPSNPPFPRPRPRPVIPTISISKLYLKNTISMIDIVETKHLFLLEL